MWSSQWGCQLWPADLEPTRRSSDDEALDLWLPPYNEVYHYMVEATIFLGKRKAHNHAWLAHRHTSDALQGVWGGSLTAVCPAICSDGERDLQAEPEHQAERSAAPRFSPRANNQPTTDTNGLVQAAALQPRVCRKSNESRQECTQWCWRTAADFNMKNCVSINVNTNASRLELDRLSDPDRVT